MLEHKPQGAPNGCLYHALFAITGDPDVLTFAGDISDARFYSRLAEFGMISLVLYACPPELARPTDPAFWQHYRDLFTRANTTGARFVPLLVTVNGLTMQHAVAVALPVHRAAGDTVIISDSNAPEPHTLTWEQFTRSEYARANRVEMLGPADVDAYPPHDPETMN